MISSIDEIKRTILPVLQRHGVRRAALFGSAARGQMRPRSDVDILVDLDRGLSLLDFIRIKLELEEALGRKVDLVEYHTIKPRLKERILSQQVPIL
jgi:uncharacterized protein